LVKRGDRPGGAVAHEARVAGLRRYVAPSLEAVDSRRNQLWVVTFVVMAGLAAGLVLLSTTEPLITRPDAMISATHLRLGLVGVTVAFGLYALEKELHLRRLTRLLIDERVLSSAFSNRLDELRHLSDAELAVNAHLQLEQVVDVVLASAVELLGGVSGAVYLRDRDGEMRLIQAKGIEGPGRGSRAVAGDGLVGAVMAAGEAVLGESDDHVGPGAVSGAVMAAPIRSDRSPDQGELLGVLLIRKGPDGLFSEYDVRVLNRFAEHAAPALAHAALYEGEQRHVAELVERNRLTSSLVAMVSHEFKAPLAAIIGAVRTLQRRDLPRDHVATFLEMIESQGERLSRLVEDVLELRRGDGIGDLQSRRVDAVAVAEDVVEMSRAAGRDLALRAPGEVLAMADAGALQQILLNLIDNAFVHGGGTVEVEVDYDGDQVRLTVLDRGAGVPLDEYDRIFEIFARGGHTTKRGSGLGLYLVRTLVEAQRGTVVVARRPEGGADFTVRLPAATAVAAEVAGGLSAS
jgi:two-component system sensor histidine kinase KdpD